MGRWTALWAALASIAMSAAERMLPHTDEATEAERVYALAIQASREAELESAEALFAAALRRDGDGALAPAYAARALHSLGTLRLILRGDEAGAAEAAATHARAKAIGPTTLPPLAELHQASIWAWLYRWWCACGDEYARRSSDARLIA